MNRNYVKKMLLIVALVQVLPSLAGAMEVWDFVIFCGTATPAELQEMMDVPGFKVNVSDEYGCTPLHTAAVNPNPGVITVLLNAGADAKVKDNDGNLPIDYADENQVLKGTPELEALRKASY